MRQGGIGLSNWEEYLKTRSNKLRNEIVKEYTGFVKYLTGRVIQQLPPGLTKEDLVQYGIYGLIDAVERFDPKQGAKFETYASQRIRGAILDQVRYYGRAGGGLSRSSMEKSKMIERATKKLEEKHKRNPTSQEIADELGLEMKDYNKMLSDVSYGSQISLDQLIGTDQNTTAVQVIKNESVISPEEAAIEDETKDLLSMAIDELPEKEQKIIFLYYYDEMTLKEIGIYLGLSESRISQLHTQAMLRLRNKMTGGE